MGLVRDVCNICTRQVAPDAKVALAFRVSTCRDACCDPLYDSIAVGGGRCMWAFMSICFGEHYEFLINENVDLRIPFCTGQFCVGPLHWDLGPLAPKLLLLLGFTLPGIVATIINPFTVILWRHRHEKIQHGKRQYSFWKVSVADPKQEPGMLWTVVVLAVGWAIYLFHTWVWAAFNWYEDSATTKEEHCGGSNCFSNTWSIKVYALSLVLMMPVSVWWGKPLPRRRRDLVAGYILAFYSFLFVFVAGQIVVMAYQNYGEGKFQALSTLSTDLELCN